MASASSSSAIGAAKATGTLEALGKASVDQKPARRAAGRHGIALVPRIAADRAFLLTKSVRETARGHQALHRQGFPEQRKEVSLVKEMVDFRHSRPTRPSASRARFRAATSRRRSVETPLTQVRVLSLYDPTRGVDVGTKGEIFQLTARSRRQGLRHFFHSSDTPELSMSWTACSSCATCRIAATLNGDRLSEENIPAPHNAGCRGGLT